MKRTLAVVLLRPCAWRGRPLLQPRTRAEPARRPSRARRNQQAPPGFDAAGFANAQSHYNPGSQYDATPLAPFRDGLGRPSRPGPFGGSRPAYRITRTLSRTASAVRSRAAAPSLTNTWNS